MAVECPEVTCVKPYPPPPGQCCHTCQGKIGDHTIKEYVLKKGWIYSVKFISVFVQVLCSSRFGGSGTSRTMGGRLSELLMSDM